MDNIGDEELIKLRNDSLESSKPRDIRSSPTELVVVAAAAGAGIIKNQDDKHLEKATTVGSQGKENHNNKDQRFCHKCNKSLAKSSHLIDITGQTYKWHPECFKCNICHQPMDRASTCYIYKDKIVCRDDYFKLKQDNSIRCSRCRWPISASDWVRKAGDFVYHLACFSCDICLRQLSTGEQFTVNIQEKNVVRLLCRLHFAIEPPQGGPTTSSDNATHPDSTGQTPSSFEFTYRHHCSPNNAISNKFSQSHHHLRHNNQADQQQQYLHLLASTSQTAMLLNRKSSDQLPPCDELNADESPPIGCGQQRIGGASTSSSAGSSSALGQGLPSKSKRVRTTFTEDQLSILQTHFQIDSNPDGQDLERIATITGLSKRVTQVWFQNSRARQKKYMIKRKPSSTASSATALVSAGIGLALGSSSHQFDAEASDGHHHGHSRQQQQHRISRAEALPTDGHEESSAGPADCYQTKWSNMSDRSDVSIANENIDNEVSRASSSSSTSSPSSSIDDQLIVSDDNSNE